MNEETLYPVIFFTAIVFILGIWMAEISSKGAIALLVVAMLGMLIQGFIIGEQ